MKKIAFVIPTMRMGGAEKSLVSLLKSLDSNVVDVDLYLFEAGGSLQHQIPRWVNVIELDFVTRAMTLELRKYIGTAIKKGRILAAFDRIKLSIIKDKKRFSWDVIKKHIPKVEKEYDVAIGFLEGVTDYYVIDKIDAKRKIGWIHTDMTGRLPSQREQYYYEQFDMIATISKLCKDSFVSLYPSVENKMVILENIVLESDVCNLANEQLDINWDKNVRHIVTVGRLEHAKGIDIAAEACKNIINMGMTDFCWHIYGTGSMQKSIEKYITENDISSHFLLEGQVSNPYPFMKNADLIVQPSRCEGKSLVIDEAKILGKPIVVTDYSSVKDQIVNGVTGVITQKDPKNMASCIIKTINNDKLKIELSSNCKKISNESFKIVKRFYEVIELDEGRK